MTDLTTPKRHVYERLHASTDFQQLRRKYRSFAFTWTVVFLVWYLLYVIASAWARDFMATTLVGNINVALVFGLLQFASTFGIAWLYSKRATRDFDPLAARLQERYDAETHESQEVSR